MDIIEPMSGVGLRMKEGQILTIFDIQGEQVSDLFCVNEVEPHEHFSSGRTIDYNSRLKVRTGDLLYSSFSRPMFRVIEDDVESHDITLTPCSYDTFQRLYDPPLERGGCEGNIVSCLKEFGVVYHSIPPTFNIFMNVSFHGPFGGMEIGPPKSKAGDKIRLMALMNMIVAITACSAPNSNNGVCKPIGYEWSSPGLIPSTFS